MQLPFEFVHLPKQIRVMPGFGHLLMASTAAAKVQSNKQRRRSHGYLTQQRYFEPKKKNE